MSNAPTSPPPWWALLGLAVLATALNAAKPCQADDFTYLRFAQEFADHPLAPYDFKYELPPYELDGIHVLVPPVVPYWLALATRVGGDGPVWLRACLFPFVALFVVAAYALLRRVGCPFPALLAGALLFSPVVLPGINCMLDVPALALVLAAAAVQWRAGESGSWGLALLAGLLAGLAMQTKYTAFVAVPLLVLAGLLQGRWRLGLASALLAGGLFVGWEGFLVASQGTSHFLAALEGRSGSPVLRMLHLVLPSITHSGALLAGLASMGLVALGRPRLALLPLGLALVTVPLLACLPEPWLVWGPTKHPWQVGFGLGHVLHGLAGLMAIAATGVVVWRLTREDTTPLGRFLLAWLVLEVGAMFLLSPFPAARRYMGCVAVLALLVGRLAGRLHGKGVPLMEYRWAAAATALLGLMYFSVDFAEAWALEQSAARAVARAARVADGGRTWSCAWVGFEYYAERAGARPFTREVAPRPGDAVVVLEHDHTQAFAERPPIVGGLEWAEEGQVPCLLPVCLGTGYYAGRSPLSRSVGPPRRAIIYRVTGKLKYPGDT